MEENDIAKDFRPREYQVELFEKVLRKNTIIFLPTGSGKTFIAVMLIKHKADDIKLAYSKGGKRTFFLVETVALVSQQAQAIRQQTPLTVGEYSGDMGTEHWNINQWKEELEKYQVLVMTAEIFLQMVLHAFISFNRVNLLIIDECHHAVNKHPMKKIMEQFQGVGESDRPHILGLTATLLNANVKPHKIKEEIHNLEITFHAKIARAKNEEMIQTFSTCPKEEIIFYEAPEADACYTIIKSTVENLELILANVILQNKGPKPTSSPTDAVLMPTTKTDPLTEIKNNLKEITLLAFELGGIAASYAMLLRIVHFERMRFSSNDSSLIKVLGHVIAELHLTRKKLDSIMKKDSIKIIKFTSPKVRKLFTVLKDFESENLALVFVQRRTTAKVLYYILDDLAMYYNEYTNIRADFMVGFNNNPYHLTRENVLEKKKNSKTLKRFNSGEINVLVASDVIEEGIDVKNCNFVIKFDYPKTIRSYIQSKGRARHVHSKYIVLAPMSETNFPSNFNNFKLAEEKLKEELCHGKDVYRKGGTEKEAELYLYPDQHEIFTSPSGAKLTINTSISLLNRYTATLPSDKFTKLTVFYWKKSIMKGSEVKIIGYLQLPVNSPIKDIIKGPPCNDLSYAKAAVAFEACKKLYEIGELNSNLLPAENDIERSGCDLLSLPWDSENDDLPAKLVGTRKARRTYNKHFPRWICGDFPNEGKQLYLHVIKITPNYPKPEYDRLLAFYNLLMSNQNFSVLTTKKWPKLCDFPLFMNVGEVNITIEQNARSLFLDKQKIKKIFAFHCLLFTEGLSLKKEFLVKDSDSKDNTYFVVPTIVDNEEVCIDWDTIDNNKHIPPVKAVPLDFRENIVVNKEKYYNKIVVPWYRPKGTMLKYVVTKVCEEQTPMSPFPSDQFDSYCDYFQQRYQHSILNKNQKLIEVRAISGKINCLLPRGKYRLGKKRRRDEEDFEETLVAELCTLLEFPAVYMLKVTLLPSVFHRISILLNAEELRLRIATETGLGVIKLPKGVHWDALQVDDTALSCDESANARSTIAVSDMLIDRMDKLLPNDCTWAKEEEPMDIEKNIKHLDFLSVIHYEKFVNQPIEPYHNQSELIFPPNVKTPCITILNSENSLYGPQLRDITKALISSSANDIMNYERLETLGDSYLKFIVSLMLFTYFENKDEGKLSHYKGKIIGNKNLFYCGKNINLGSILKVFDFVPDDWEVPGFTLLKSIKEIIKSGNISPSVLYQINLTKKERETSILNEKTMAKIHELFCEAIQSNDTSLNSLGIIGQQSVVDKVIADAVEALIGVYLEHCGIEGAFKLCKWLKVLPEEMCDMDRILYQPAPTAKLFGDEDINDVLIMPETIEKILDYNFRDRSFLLQAMTHCSYTHSATDCYQRLEFLGDAVLDFLITSHIYCKCKRITPGELTDLRSALVNNVTFACLTVRYGFHKFLLTKACKLTDIIRRFVEHQEKRNHKIGAEILFLLNESEVEAAEIVDVPKVLGDIFESLAGAVYLDSGKSLETVWRVFYKLMHKEIDNFCDNIPKNSIRLLYEKFPHPSPVFKKSEITNNGRAVLVPLVINHNNVLKPFVGVGENRSQAKLAAAKVALRHYHIKDQL